MAWLTGYTYRKKITIAGQTGASTNYQIKLQIGNASGGDFNLSGHAQSFPNDIRFTNSDSSIQLDYWIEDVAVVPITVWVKVADSLDGNVDIYCYYGKASDATTSNGTNTFLFFDDFNRANGAVGNGWTTIQGSPSISNNTLWVAHDAGSGNTGETRKISTSNIAVWEWSARLSAVNGGNNACRNYVYFMYIDASNKVFLYQSGQSGANVIQLYKVVNGVQTQLGSTYNWAANTNWNKFKVTRNSSDNYVVYYEGTSIITATDSSITTSNYIDFTADLGGGGWLKDVYIDNLRIRKYASLEPALSTVGTEEALGSLNISSTPSGAVGASVYIDGNGIASGVTPLTITGIITGTHTYRLTKTGYTEIPATNFTIFADQTTVISQTMLTVANITATSMTITPSESPCRVGICTVTVNVTWTNNGGTSGDFIPNITIDGTPYSSPYPLQSLGAGLPVTKTFTISGLAVGTRNICPYPN